MWSSETEKSLRKPGFVLWIRMKATRGVRNADLSMCFLDFSRCQLQIVVISRSVTKRLRSVRSIESALYQFYKKHA